MENWSSTGPLIVAAVVHRRKGGVGLLQQTSSKVPTFKIPRDGATWSSSIRNQPDKQLLCNHGGEGGIRMMKSGKSLRNSGHKGAELGGDLVPVLHKLEGSSGTSNDFTFDLQNLMLRRQK